MGNEFICRCNFVTESKHKKQRWKECHQSEVTHGGCRGEQVVFVETGEVSE
jgi:hypothetical protein